MKRERQRRARAKLNRKVGRPSAYKQEFAAQANRLALLGLNDTQIMGFFNVTPPTFYSWTKKHPEFLNEIQRGRIIADAEVAHALYRRAIGYSHKAVHIFVLKNGQVVTGEWNVPEAVRVAAAVGVDFEARNFLGLLLTGEPARNCGQQWRRACETTHSEGAFWARPCGCRSGN